MIPVCSSAYLKALASPSGLPSMAGTIPGCLTLSSYFSSTDSIGWC